MRNLVFTGRFQPLHSGHIEMLRAIKEQYPDDLLIICIVRNTSREVKPEIDNAFNVISRQKQKKNNNPLPNWERYMLLKLAVENDDVLKRNTAIIFRERADISWKKSVADLPDDRIFILPSEKRDEFDIQKHKFYRDINERVKTVSYGKKHVSATDIRNKLYSGDYDLSFLPFACVDYFKSNCLKYFVKNRTV